MQEVEKAFKPAFDTLADLEKRERLDMQLKHSADSQKRAMDIASGRDEKLYEAAKELEAAKDPSLAFKKAAEAEETLQAHFTEAAQDGYDPPAPDEDTAEDEIGDGEDIRSLADEIEDQGDQSGGGGSGSGVSRDEAEEALRDLYRAAAEEEARREAEKIEDDERDPDLEDDNEYEIKPPGFTGPKP